MQLTDTQKELLGNIQRKLMRGDIKSIAEKTGKSQDYVGMVLNSNSNHFNMEIVEAAAFIISTREQNTKKLLEIVIGEA